MTEHVVSFALTTKPTAEMRALVKRYGEEVTVESVHAARLKAPCQANDQITARGFDRQLHVPIQDSHIEIDRQAFTGKFTLMAVRTPNLLACLELESRMPNAHSSPKWPVPAEKRGQIVCA